MTQAQQSISMEAGAVRQDETDLWVRFVDADPAATEAFCRNWLELQCRMLPAVLRGMVLLGEPDTGPFRSVAVWPSAQQEVATLGAIAERSLAERRGLLESAGQADTAAACGSSTGT